MENTQEKILSELKDLVAEIRIKTELLENKYVELEKCLSSKAVEDIVSEPVPEEDEAIDIDFGMDEVFNGSMPADDDALAEKMADPVSQVNEIPVAVIDAMTERQAWRKDIPGASVNDVRSAISLNDRILFIRSLFSDDAVLFQNTLDRINSAGSIDEAVKWLMSEFAGWNFESDTVYRFMMAVRRKLK